MNKLFNGSGFLTKEAEDMVSAFLDPEIQNFLSRAKDEQEMRVIGGLIMKRVGDLVLKNVSDMNQKAKDDVVKSGQELPGGGFLKLGEP